MKIKIIIFNFLKIINIKTEKWKDTQVYQSYHTLNELLQQMEKNAQMSHKLVKRHCSCQPSSCSCSPIQITLQISCSCPQICRCTSPAQPIYPPVTYTMPTTRLPPVTYTLPPVTYTLPPVTYTLPPVTYTLPPVTYTQPPITRAPIITTQSPYCCILFICASCGYSGSTYNEVNF